MLINGMNPINIVENKPINITFSENIMKEIGYFETGECPVVFNPETGELSVEINVKKLMIPFIDDKLEGHVQHTFTGFISEDSTIWDADWFEALSRLL